MKIIFIGTGYVGLVSGAAMAKLGHEVLCVDNDQAKIHDLNKAVIHIYEPDLTELVRQKLTQEQLIFKNSLAENLSFSQVVFIAVGTPEALDGSADLSYIYQVIDEIISSAQEQKLIVIKSTVPPGTCKKLQQYLFDAGTNHIILTNPEFLREGSALHDFLHPTRIIVGIENQDCHKIIDEIYHPLTKQNYPLIKTNLTTAELIKYASNSFLATKISFINEMANLCEATGGDISALSYGIGLDPRIGKEFLKAGPGYGGSCFPKDTSALAHIAREYQQPLTIIESVVKSNYNRKYIMLEKIKKSLGGDVKEKVIGILGLAFKAGTNDVRDSQALEIIELLLDEGALIKAYDPISIKEAQKLLKDEVQFCTDSYKTASNADCLVIVTEWPEFSKLNYKKIYDLMMHPIIIDLRNILNPLEIRNHGFKYDSIGRQ